MEDHRKTVKLRWIAAAVVPLSFMAAARFGFAADRASSPSKSDPGGTSSTAPEMPSANPLLDKLCFPCKGPTTLKGSEWIPVDPNKRYTLSGWFKSVGKEPSNLYFGYICFDADKKLIAPEQVGIVGDTETTLYEDCKKEIRSSRSRTRSSGKRIRMRASRSKWTTPASTRTCRIGI